MTIVLDVSTLLAYLQDEPGSDLVEAALQREPICGAANWSEVAQKIHAAERDWDLVEALLMSYDLTIEPVTSVDADIITADTDWGSAGRIRQIR